MAKIIRVNLSIIQRRMEKILDFAWEHRMQDERSLLKHATICTKILEFVIDLRHHEIYSRILEREGLTLFELIQRALQDYAARHGYLRKGR